MEYEEYFKIPLYNKWLKEEYYRLQILNPTVYTIEGNSKLKKKIKNGLLLIAIRSFIFMDSSK